jgi:hypothetical protein
MLKKLKNKRGEGYIDMCVGVVVFVMVLVIAINIFSFITLRIELDQIADELIETVTYGGCFDDAYYSRYSELTNQYFEYDVACGADKYFNTSLRRVQLGDPMWVKVSVDTYIKGLGVFKIPVTVTVKKSGLSERYWK